MHRRIALFLIGHRSFTDALHRLLHLNGQTAEAEDACPLCRLMWVGIARDAFKHAIEVEPDGHVHFYPWAAVKASKFGGAAPRCRYCGEAAR